MLSQNVLNRIDVMLRAWENESTGQQTRQIFVGASAEDDIEKGVQEAYETLIVKFSEKLLAMANSAITMRKMERGL